MCQFPARVAGNWHIGVGPDIGLPHTAVVGELERDGVESISVSIRRTCEIMRSSVLRLETFGQLLEGNQSTKNLLLVVLVHWQAVRA